MLAWETMSSSTDQTIDVVTDAQGPDLLTRDQGRALLERILARLREDDTLRLRLDFKGVGALSPSFVDELFGGLQQVLGTSFRERIRVASASPPYQSLIKYVLHYRRSNAPSPS